MKLLKNLFVYGLFLWSLTVVRAQSWSACTFETNYLDTIYDLSRDAKFPKLVTTFPEFEFYQPVTKTAYRLLANAPGITNDNGNVVKISLPDISDFFTNKDYHIVTDLYTKNIGRIIFAFRSPIEDIILFKEIKFEYDGYQEPVDFAISDFKRNSLLYKKYSSAIDTTASNPNIVYIFVEKISEAAIAEIDAANLVVARKQTKEKNLASDFYHPMRHNPISSKYESIRFISPYIRSSTSQENSQVLASSIFLKGPKTENQQKKLLIEMVEKSLIDYPFYEERSLDKSEVLASYKILSNEFSADQSFQNLASKIGHFLDSLIQDGHMGINVNQPKARRKLVYPVRLYSFGKKVLVSAVFDKRITNKLPIGAEIYSIDQINTADLINSNFGDVSKSKASGDVSKWVGKPAGDSTFIRYHHPNSSKTDSLVIYYDGNLEIGTNFISKQCHYRDLGSGIAYFQIKNWSLEVYRRFITQWDRFSEAKKIIFDLRGNGGGNALSVIRLLSVLLPKESSIYAYRDFEGNMSDSLVVTPNPDYYINNNVEVVILGDRNTACASEIFIGGLLANRDKTVFVATESTAGTLANRYDISFNDQVTFYTSALIGKPLLKKFGCIEHKGIEPDIKVQYETISDLKPYEDLLLKTAIAH